MAADAAEAAKDRMKKRTRLVSSMKMTRAAYTSWRSLDGVSGWFDRKSKATGIVAAVIAIEIV